ncbi:MAG: dTMP kinase [Deltaproteobacteria bacterium]|nr:dTMP kinase [Deltaproteobacteria bacterium]
MGLFITLEGIEGSGKSTQMELLREHLEDKGKDVLTLREPGGVWLAEMVRPILLNRAEGMNMEPLAELFLYEACRAQLVKQRIRPALGKGRVVVCDRFTDAILAYQGYGRGLDIQAVAGINRLAAFGLVPDLTILIDISPEAGLKRAFKRIEGKEGAAKEDRFENESLKFHTKVRDGYLKIAGTDPKRVRVINGEREIASVHRDICDIIDEKTTG